MTATPPRIVCAAIRCGDLIVPSPRHFDSTCHKILNALGHNPASHMEYEQGFMDQFGNFHTREEAAAIATREGQIYRYLPTDTNLEVVELYSEHLY